MRAKTNEECPFTNASVSIVFCACIAARRDRRRTRSATENIGPWTVRLKFGRAENSQFRRHLGGRKRHAAASNSVVQRGLCAAHTKDGLGRVVDDGTPCSLEFTA